MEVLGINGVHVGKVGEIRHEHSGFDHVGVVHAVCAEHAADVLEDPCGLLGDPARNNVPGNRVQGNLSRTVESVARRNGLGVGTDGGGSFRGGDHFTHRSQAT